MLWLSEVSHIAMFSLPLVSIFSEQCPIRTHCPRQSRGGIYYRVLTRISVDQYRIRQGLEGSLIEDPLLCDQCRPLCSF